uniref:Uncharacterized protein n=1 Tax=Craspedostauros australis TaxID=1486917 RepID=A0A7R9ZS62_9STRA
MVMEIALRRQVSDHPRDGSDGRYRIRPFTRSPTNSFPSHTMQHLSPLFPILGRCRRGSPMSLAGIQPAMRITIHPLDCPLFFFFAFFPRINSFAFLFVSWKQTPTQIPI